MGRGHHLSAVSSLLTPPTHGKGRKSSKIKEAKVRVKGWGQGDTPGKAEVTAVTRTLSLKGSETRNGAARAL